MMTEGKYVAYYRVSTAKQGRSGLGLEAQQAAVRAYLKSANWAILGEHTEVESGKRADRPELALAIRLCKLTGATLAIAKLDRLSRDAHFLLGLEKAGVRFAAVDMPTANELTVGIMAVVAQEERKAIASRTKSALAAAKARGTKLGGWRGGPKVDQAKGAAAARLAADAFAERVGPMVREMRDAGKSLRAIAAELTAKGIMTARGGTWTATAVRNLLARR